MDFITKGLGGLWNGIKSIFEMPFKIAGGIGSAFSWLTDKLVLGARLDVLGLLGTYMMGVICDAIGKAFNSPMFTAFGKTLHTASAKLWDLNKQGANEVLSHSGIDKIDPKNVTHSLTDGANALTDAMNGDTTKLKGMLPSMPKMPSFEPAPQTAQADPSPSSTPQQHANLGLLPPHANLGMLPAKPSATPPGTADASSSTTPGTTAGVKKTASLQNLKAFPTGLPDNVTEVRVASNDAGPARRRVVGAPAPDMDA